LQEESAGDVGLLTLLQPCVDAGCLMKLFGSEDRLSGPKKHPIRSREVVPFFSLEASFCFESSKIYSHCLLLIVLMVLGRLKLLSAAMDR
jgi:hypothetical protein